MIGIIVVTRAALLIARHASTWNKDAAESTLAVQLADQIKDLQTQLADLKKQIGNALVPRIVAAGTATWTCPQSQANDTDTRVKLIPEIIARLGTNYIVLLT